MNSEDAIMAYKAVVRFVGVVQELLGHPSLNTMQVYLSVAANHLEEAIELLD